MDLEFFSKQKKQVNIPAFIEASTLVGNNNEQ